MWGGGGGGGPWWTPLAHGLIQNVSCFRSKWVVFLCECEPHWLIMTFFSKYQALLYHHIYYILTQGKPTYILHTRICSLLIEVCLKRHQPIRPQGHANFLHMKLQRVHFTNMCLSWADKFVFYKSDPVLGSLFSDIDLLSFIQED